MNEHQAKSVARALRGEAWQSGGNIWVILFRRSDGKIVVMSDEVIKLFDNEESQADGRTAALIRVH